MDTSHYALPAADLDLIEQHWAAAVQQLESQFAEQPAAYAAAYAALKAQYVAARYGKTLSTGEVARPSEAKEGQTEG